MLKMLIKLLLVPPDLLREHLLAYADWVATAWQQQRRACHIRWCLYALASACVGLAMVSASVSCLLWAALPELGDRHVPVLWALPLAWLVAGLACAVWARRFRQRPWSAQLLDQLRLDAQLLRSAPSP